MAQSYVRTEMLPEQDPPSTAVGAVRWAADNLFSSWLNAILTILSILIVGSFINAVWPWLITRSVWNAGSLAECREIISHQAPRGAIQIGDIWALPFTLLTELFSGALSLDFMRVVSSPVTAWNAMMDAFQTSPEAGGACFAIIKARWHQLMFGFYPQDLYWRPILAFVLMLVALAPVLFNRLPRNMMWFSITYPALAFWLLWGGTVFLPILIMLGFVFGYVAAKILGRFSSLLAVIGGMLVPILYWLFLMGPVLGVINQGMASSLRDGYIVTQQETVASLQVALELVEENSDEGKALTSSIKTESSKLDDAFLLQDLRDTVPDLREAASELRDDLPDAVKEVFDVSDIVSGTSGEDVEALNQALDAEQDVVNAVARITSIETEVGRLGLIPLTSDQFGGFMLSTIIGVTGIAFSLPIGILLALGRQSNLFLIRTICIGFIEFIRGVPLITLLFTASLLLNYFLPPGANFDLILRVIIMVTLFASAYMAEVIRGGLAALPRGQYEAADALGLDYWKSQQLIIMPQALKISIPGIVSTFIGLFKDTTLVVFIGLLDPLGLASSIRATQEWNGVYWELFIFIGAMFWLVCFGMSRYSMYLERRLKTSH